MNNGLFGLPQRQPPALVRIREVVTQSSQTTVNFTTIPQNYRDLIIVVRGRTTAATTAVFVQVQLNGDTGANYDFSRENRYGISPALAQTAMQMGELIGTTGAAGSAALCHATIGDYRGAVFHKTLDAQATFKISNATGDIIRDAYIGVWRNVTPIHSVLISLSSGGFENGSVVTLYGRT